MRFFSPAVVLLLLLAAVSLHAQTDQRLCTATRCLAPPRLDGVLDDSCWVYAAVADGFIQQSPNPGKTTRHSTEVRILFDDAAVYLGVRMNDSSPDSILKQLSARDDFDVNADQFNVIFDAFYDRRNAYEFGVTAAGVQYDSRIDFDKHDYSWNAVWFSKTRIDEKGWVVEMKIPYNALRFPNQEKQQWGLNFQRTIRRYREQSNWNTVKPEMQGRVNQAGMLQGIQQIKAPLRLSFVPYVSGYIENYRQKNSFAFNGGMDVKYGINESFTLDMTLIPDFGQTQSDNLVLNLSPFEVKFDERRYFFTEGTELFNKNDLFYSRRIGATPSGYGAVQAQLEGNEIIADNPNITKLLNATKISGRTRSKLGLGFFNAVNAPVYAELYDTISGTHRQVETEPATNYNVLVVDQALKNNSFFSFINTNVWRSGAAREANVTGTQLKLSNKKNTYTVEGSGNVSLIFRDGFNSPERGHFYNLRAARTRGNYLCEVRHRLVSDRYNPNDLGYLDRNNNLSYSFDQQYNIYKPFGRFNRMNNELGIDYIMLYAPRHFTFFNIDGKHIFTTRRFHTFGFNWLAQPVTNFDYFETRVPGRYYLYPRNAEGGGFISSDYRRMFALDASLYYRSFAERRRSITRYSFSPRWRASDRLMLIFRLDDEWKEDNVGFADLLSDSVIFGLRDVHTVTNTLTVKYIFTSRMSLSFRARHYWSAAAYKMYFLLREDGTLQGFNYTGNKNVNYNAFNIDMVYTWQFLPGSELSVVWKNSIYTLGSAIAQDYFSDWDIVSDAAQINSFSLKLIWYIESRQLMRKR
jgi:hypothetical protein